MRAILIGAILLIIGAVSTAHSACMPGKDIPPGFELFNYGQQWNMWSDRDRLVYLSGFVDGQNHTVVSLRDALPADSRERLWRETFVRYPQDTLADVMTSLYADPANTFITHASMVYMARDKLAGKDIEASLRYARQNECADVQVRR
jgi:hypothetical protein